MPQRSFYAFFVLVCGLMLSACVPVSIPAESALPVVNPVIETEAILNMDKDAPAGARLGDADDPAIWVNPTDAALSLVIGTLKNGGLDVYDLDGKTLQSIAPEGARYNNVDVQYGFKLDGKTIDLAVATDRYADKLAFFAIDPTTRQLKDVSDPANPLVFTPAGQASDKATTAYGIALYRSARNRALYAFVTRRATSEIAQLEIVDNGNGLLGARPVRLLKLPVPGGDLDPQAEGMVADYELGFVYIAQEDVGIWKFSAEPDSGTEGVLIHKVAPTGNTLVADAEGLTIYYTANRKGYLLASSQGDNRFSAYTREGDNQYLGSFVIGQDNGKAAIDGSQICDGAQVINVPLGERFPHGLLVVQDGSNEPVQMVTDEGETENVNTNFKFVPWDAVANAFPTPLVIDTTSYDPRAVASMTATVTTTLTSTPTTIITTTTITTTSPITASAPVTAQGSISAVFTLPDLPLAAVQNAMLTNTITNDRQILLGGVGSDLWYSAGDPTNEFWMVTDRGPNGQIKIDEKNRRTFPVPAFTPLILHVQAIKDKLTVLQTIPIVTPAGQPVTGLSNLDGFSEAGWDVTAQTKLAFNPNGLDTEGLVRTSTGDFWLVDEYAPSIIHVDASGHVVKRFVPDGLDYSGADYPVAATLPAILRLRQNNRGFEGLALSADEKTLYVALQSPLDTPSNSPTAETLTTRIFAFDTVSEQVIGEYIYCFNDPAEYNAPDKPDEMKLSGMVALNPTTLLILERTDAVAKLYTADLSQATNVLGSEWDEPAIAKSMENWTAPEAAEYHQLPKTLVLDLSQLPSMPAKIEGITVLDKQTIAIANDNDFNLGEFDAQGNNSKAPGVQSQLLMIQLTQPLP